MNQEKVYIFDTTLRDGDQGTGTPFTRPEKLLVAQKLARAGVDVIEAGFARSRVDSDSIKAVVEEIGKNEDSPIISSLSRGDFKDIDASFDAVKDAKRPRIHTFIATSDKHMAHKLKLTRSEVIDNILKSVSYAAKTGAEVEWSAEDALNSDPAFVLEASIAAIESGSTIINIPDTLGGSNPWTVEGLFRYLNQGTAHLKEQGKKFIFSSHSHNDNGFATANAIAAVRGGARQIETTVRGIGERAGNAKFHEIVAFLSENGDKINEGTSYVIGVENRLVFPVSYLVSRIIGMPIPPHEPIIGSRANSHGSGIHTDGAFKGKAAAGEDIYSIISASKYGNPGEIKTFNARGGGAEVAEMLNLFGIVEKDKTALNDVTTKCCKRGEKARGIYANNVLCTYLEETGRFKISGIDVITEQKVRITLIVDGKTVVLEGKASNDNGIIDATVNAINNYLATKNPKLSITIDSYNAEDRESPLSLAKDFGLKIKRAHADSIGSEKIGIVTFVIKGSDGGKHYTRDASHNVNESEIRAIIQGSITYIFDEFNKC